MPIYVNKEHFTKNRKLIEDFIMAIKYGYKKRVEMEFQPGIIFEIFPTVLNKLIVYMQDSTVHKSNTLIEIYI